MKTSRPFLALVALACGCSGATAASVPPQTATRTTTTTTASQTPYHVAAGDLDAALAGPQRTEAERARDPYRHPRETLAFFGVHPGVTVVELSPGNGWYTEILAPLLHDAGQLVAAAGDPNDPNAHGAAEFAAKLTQHPEIYGNVHRTLFAPPEHIDLGPDGSADVVVTFRNVHNWVGNHAVDAVFAAAFRVLRPGGVLGVEDHRAAPGADPATSSRQGYVTEAFVIETAQRAGFVLDERSEINANPRDTKDYPEGVWTLPPTLRLGERDRARYLAIGESDRMTLRFRRPAAH